MPELADDTSLTDLFGQGYGHHLNARQWADRCGASTSQRWRPVLKNTSINPEQLPTGIWLFAERQSKRRTCSTNSAK